MFIVSGIVIVIVMYHVKFADHKICGSQCYIGTRYDTQVGV